MSGLVHGVLEHIREFPFFSFLIALVAIVPVAIGYIFLRVYTVSSLNAGRDGKQKKTDVWTEDDFDQSLQAERASKDNMTLDDELGLTAKDPRELGGKCDEYDWLQTDDEIVVEVLLPKETRSKDCKVTITSSSLSVNVGEKKIVSGQLLRMVLADECIWELDYDGEHKRLSITLVKAEKTRGNKHWSCVVKGSPKIDTPKFSPPVTVVGDDPGALLEAMKQ